MIILRVSLSRQRAHRRPGLASLDLKQDAHTEDSDEGHVKRGQVFRTYDTIYKPNTCRIGSARDGGCIKSIVVPDSRPCMHHPPTPMFNLTDSSHPTALALP